MTVSTPCIFELNGERHVPCDLLRFIIAEVEEVDGQLFRGIIADLTTPFTEHLLSIRFTDAQVRELSDFFSDEEIKSWKLFVPDEDTDCGYPIVVIFDRHPILTLHISISAGLKACHYETSLAGVYKSLKDLYVNF